MDRNASYHAEVRFSRNGRTFFTDIAASCSWSNSSDPMPESASQNGPALYGYGQSESVSKEGTEHFFSGLSRSVLDEGHYE